jgi:primase-polymerase (primpol)-like protein
MTMANYSLIPEELQMSNRFLAWQNVERDSKSKKVPVSKDGYPVPYNDTNALLTCPEIQQLCAQKSEYNCGISLLDGLIVHLGEKKGYLWCLDFDGFRSPSGELSDSLIQMLFQKAPSYVEVSPSGTGFKYFFVTERPPQENTK